MTTSAQSLDEQERLHRQRCADWFQQMYGKELEDTFGFEPQNRTLSEPPADDDGE